MSQPMPTGLYRLWDLDSKTGRFTPQQNESRSFENMVMSYFQRTRPDFKIESFYTTGRQKKYDRFSVHGFCSHCNTVFEAMGCYFQRTRREFKIKNTFTTGRQKKKDCFRVVGF